MAQKQVLQEFLMSLGWSVDQTGARRFLAMMGTVGKVAQEVGKSLAAVAVAAEAAVGILANQFEKLYYASKRTGQTVETLKALDFAAGQVGLTAEEVQGALENMAAAMRANPGLKGLLTHLGIDPNSKNLLTDFVKQMSKLPFFVAQQFGAQFGIDPQTLNQLIMFLPEFIRAQEKSKQMMKDAGLNAETLAETSKKYMNLLREIWERVELISAKFLQDLLPAFQKFAQYVNEALTALMKFKSADFDNLLGDFGSDLKSIITDLREFIGMLQWLGSSDYASAGLHAIKEGLLDIAKMVSSLSAALVSFATGNWKKAGAHVNDAIKHLTRGMPGGEDYKSGAESQVDSMYGGGGGRKPADGSQGKFSGTQRYLTALEGMYGLPAGLLDRIWNQESRRGRYMLSPKGAQGHFGFMPRTAEEYGLKDPNDFSTSAEASAKYMGNLLRMFDGDIKKAVAAYNWGPGNVANKGLGSMPAETRKYVQDVAGGLTFNQETNITVHGAGDPKGTADKIGSEQGRVNGDLIRNLKPNLQ